MWNPIERTTRDAEPIRVKVRVFRNNAAVSLRRDAMRQGFGS
jgi:hypothetical protein